MSFDVNNNFVTPVIFSSQDELTAAKLDLVVDEVATALTTLKAGLQNVSSTGSTTVSISGVTGLQAALNGKQPTLSGTPIFTTDLGTTVAPLTNGKIPSQYIPDTSGPTTSTGVNSFNTRTGAVSLSLTDVTAALAYTPAHEVHTHDIVDVNGLSTALAGKQDTLGFTPANATHTHTIAQVTGLQSALDAIITVSTSFTAAETEFPLGHYVLVYGTATVAMNAAKAIYTSIPSSGTYALTSGGSLLNGTWQCRGVQGNSYLFQRTA